MSFLANLLIGIINIYIFIIVIMVVVSWLIAFDVINVKSPQTQNLLRLLKKLTDPVFKPVQKYIPAIGGIDITPIVVIFMLEFVFKGIIYFIF